MGSKSRNIWDDFNHPEVQKRMDDVSDVFRRDPELRKSVNGLTDEEYGSQYRSTLRDTVENNRENADMNLSRWAEKTLPHTSCPECAAHLFSTSVSYMREGGVHETPNYFGLLNGYDSGFKPLHEWLEEKSRSKGGLSRRDLNNNFNDEERRQHNILQFQAYTKAQPFLTNMFKTLGEMALSRGTLCPLHSRIPRG